MKIVVLKWIIDDLIPFIGRCIELLFRIILCLLPLGVYLILIQQRKKASKVSSLTTFTTDNSVWQHIFPGFLLVAIEPTVLSDYMNKKKNDFQYWVKRNEYILAIIFMTAIVSLMLFSYIK